ncbi:hypothetical protein KIN20_025232 [Parelaphostrongylus tenuis]|uniref:Uncharacterized protein n=1 Tax=Parelaphostrongylus tenuis TaxID=148309 RepID=A0AAD5ND96_PARTN|nr:hypothetical protein KIN20_025232 [Parelaphostrongylus tenuis]
MIRRDVRDIDDDDDGPSEATIKLTAKMDEKFRRAFPLRGEAALRRPRPIAPPTLSQISKRLNFDDSLGATSATNSKVKLVELNEEVDSLKRRLNNAHNDIQRLKLSENSEKKRSEHLQMEIVQLKKEKEMVKQSSSVKLDEVKREVEEVALSRDRWREAATCFYRYFQSTKARLTLAEKEMLSRGLLNEDLRRAIVTHVPQLIQHLWRQYYVESVPEPHRSVTASLSLGGDQSLLFSQSESVLNNTLANASTDYGKDERIQRLGLENSRLRDRKNVLQYKNSISYLDMQAQDHS